MWNCTWRDRSIPCPHGIHGVPDEEELEREDPPQGTREEPGIGSEGHSQAPCQTWQGAALIHLPHMTMHKNLKHSKTTTTTKKKKKKSFLPSPSLPPCCRSSHSHLVRLRPPSRNGLSDSWVHVEKKREGEIWYPEVQCMRTISFTVQAHTSDTTDMKYSRCADFKSVSILVWCHLDRTLQAYIQCIYPCV